jgi:hypothetical protein
MFSTQIYEIIIQIHSIISAFILYVFEIYMYFWIMNNSLNIVTELVEQLKRFESEKGQEPKDLKEFTVWLKQCSF